jgi:hypothetical protein
MICTDIRIAIVRHFTATLVVIFIHVSINVKMLFTFPVGLPGIMEVGQVGISDALVMIQQTVN